MEKKRVESVEGVKQSATKDDVTEVEVNIETLEEKRHNKTERYKDLLRDQDQRIKFLLDVNREIEKEIKFKEKEARMVMLKIKEFSRLSRSNDAGRNVSKRHKQQRSLVNAQNRFTPARSKKAKASDIKSVSSKPTLDDTFKFDPEDTDTNYLDTKKTKDALTSMISAKVVKEEEEEYGSDFDEYNNQDVLDSARQETNNVTAARNNIPELQKSQDVGNMPGINSISPQNPLQNYATPQSKIAAKPSFMMKRKV